MHEALITKDVQISEQKKPEGSGCDLLEWGAGGNDRLADTRGRKLQTVESISKLKWKKLL